MWSEIGIRMKATPGGNKLYTILMGLRDFALLGLGNYLKYRNSDFHVAFDVACIAQETLLEQKNKNP
jgi:hypothetical protein